MLSFFSTLKIQTNLIWISTPSVEKLEFGSKQVDRGPYKGLTLKKLASLSLVWYIYRRYCFFIKQPFIPLLKSLTSLWRTCVGREEKPVLRRPSRGNRLCFEVHRNFGYALKFRQIYAFKYTSQLVLDPVNHLNNWNGFWTLFPNNFIWGRATMGN